MGKLYIIRKVCFFHNDLDNVRVGLGDVVGVFDDYDQANEAYLTCEKYSHQQWHIASFELKQGGKVFLKKMQDFFQKNFSQTFDFKEITQIPTLPTEATLAQTEAFINLSGLRHYDLSVHEQLPTYYKIKMADDFWGEAEIFPFTVFQTEASALYFLQESEEEATHEALSIAYSYLWQDMLEETNSHFIGLQGKLTDLSKTPDVLASYLQNCETLWYDEELQKIRLSSESEDSEVGLKELEGLFSLLIQSPFHLIQIDLEAMKNKPIQIAS